jgi:hypothetical protein
MENVDDTAIKSRIPGNTQMSYGTLPNEWTSIFFMTMVMDTWSISGNKTMKANVVMKRCRINHILLNNNALINGYHPSHILHP